MWCEVLASDRTICVAVKVGGGEGVWECGCTEKLCILMFWKAGAFSG